MLTILQEIQRCLNSGHRYAAISLTLSLPDICATLSATPNARVDGVKARYKAWCKTHLAGASIDPDLCWDLRSGVLHNGTFRHRGYDRVAFTTGNLGLHNIIIIADGANTLFLDAELFCSEIAQAAHQWYETNKDDPRVAGNLPRVVATGTMQGPLGTFEAIISDLRETRNNG